MRKEKKVLIHSVLNHLAERDPEWKTARMVAKCKVLYSGWRQAEVRANIHSRDFYTRSWIRGWLPAADFKRFLEYAMQ